MNYHILTLFPEMVTQGLSESILGRAAKKGLLSVNAVNIRDYTADRHKKVDDYPYGGGAGMLMQAQPVYDAWKAACEEIRSRQPEELRDRPVRTVYVTPQGAVFNQQMAKEFAKEEDLIFLCGHYEGIDERVLEETVTDYVSIGDYVLTGGELPAMVMIDAISRMVPGVLANGESGETESFEGDLLETVQPPGGMARKAGAKGAAVGQSEKNCRVAQTGGGAPHTGEAAGSLRRLRETDVLQKGACRGQAAACGYDRADCARAGAPCFCRREKYLSAG